MWLRFCKGACLFGEGFFLFFFNQEKILQLLTLLFFAWPLHSFFLRIFQVVYLATHKVFAVFLYFIFAIPLCSVFAISLYFELICIYQPNDRLFHFSEKLTNASLRFWIDPRTFICLIYYLSAYILNCTFQYNYFWGSGNGGL